MKIEVNVTKKYFLSIIAVIVIIGAVIGVYAGINSDKPNPGHNINEIDGVDCAVGEFLTKTAASGWECAAGGTTESGVITGTYTGGGSSSIVNLGFKPIGVLITSSSREHTINGMWYITDDYPEVEGNNRFNNGYVNGNNNGRLDDVDILETGFEAQQDANVKNKIYYYIAFS